MSYSLKRVKSKLQYWKLQKRKKTFVIIPHQILSLEVLKLLQLTENKTTDKKI